MENRKSYLCARKVLKNFENKFQPHEWEAIKRSIVMAITKSYREGRVDERKRIHADKTKKTG